MNKYLPFAIRNLYTELSVTLVYKLRAGQVCKTIEMAQSAHLSAGFLLSRCSQ